MKIKSMILLVSLLFLLTNISAVPLSNFDIVVDVYSPESANITEIWNVNYTAPQELADLKSQILKSSTDLIELQKINQDIKPHIFINQDNITNVKISFDEVHAAIRIEYNLEDYSLIQYLDYQDQIIWRFNENLFRQFVINGLFDIPKESKITVVLYDPLIIGDVSPTTNQQNRTVTWSGISTNELKIIAIEKKPPKPTFVISNIFSKNYLNSSYFYVLFIILTIILVLLIFRTKVTNSIKKFVTKHSVIKPRKQINDIVDFEFIGKKK